nr:globin-like [Rhipicephalus microplus]
MSRGHDVDDGSRLQVEDETVYLSEPVTGVPTKREVKLVNHTWNTFCRNHPDFGSFLLLSMFTEHPRTQEVFPKFKGRSKYGLENDVEFRTFGRAVGDQLADIVDSVDDYEALVAITRQNAEEHANREGVQSKHFELFFSVLLTQMLASNRSAMTTATVAAWEKVFQTLRIITREAFDEAAEEAVHSKREKETK